MYGLVSYGDAAYAIGGYSSSELQTMERYSRKLGWVTRANLPFGNHRYIRGLYLHLVECEEMTSSESVWTLKWKSFDFLSRYSIQVKNFYFVINLIILDLDMTGLAGWRTR